MKQITIEVGDLIAHKVGEVEIFSRVKATDELRKTVTLAQVNEGCETLILASMLEAGIRSKTYALYRRE